ncbi:4-(cytidine 5'-diphospho)-2-C-methyl-D-erythritol kinase [Candidatus Riesia pediculicola]|uniref:4-diphosphocytidyl-2-C-methyl-D-erythritol kinase n=1 Tax=Riesia pediculicola (strain USDA) TaxID=515618 RepID=D4G8P6_RIEPU|nr:4-(cytidine 5'-diphospho)-2-C-methyl-D-erythritol kinase [Candidatus Riesia pediculicola]ADD79519.1 4-diphosphocytidyl-2C-methyl-D-erythritol kinase [Candidatus Riesia pediculicola USDA]ARC53921.1 hypothetical protein AOE55_02065 [Candidatus Riesia pediculicola]QOJ86549.1 4-(cytidine 5'-diphospho)-2-C-methyl-D-erythritol kinase [Candidatus Riesia pediculicola]
MIFWPSPAKINLFFRVNKKREDGYHEIQTLYHFLNYGDTIGINERRDEKIKLLYNSKFKGLIKNNLILQAASLFQKYCMNNFPEKKFSGVNIYVKKVLPIGSGLGGGSSNAATTLVALNYHWRTKISKRILCSISSNLGADVPFFVNGKTSIGEGIGQNLHPIQIIPKWYLIAYPKVSVSTKEIFKKLNLKKISDRIPREILLNNKYQNDLEEFVKHSFPEVKKCINWFKKKSLSPIMTGTGSCIFVQFSSKSDALKILKSIPKWMECFVAEGANDSPLYTFKSYIMKEKFKREDHI